MANHWHQIWGIVAVLTGVYYIFKRRIAVGIEGRRPWFYAEGMWAILIGAIVILLGIVVIFEIIEFTPGTF